MRNSWHSNCERCYGFGYDNNGVIEKNKVHSDEDEEENEKHKIKDEDKPKLNIKPETVCELLEEYLLNEFTQTNVFGRYINENGFEKHDSSSYHLSQKDEEIKKIMKSRKRCKYALFGDKQEEKDIAMEYKKNDNTAYDDFKELIKYTMQDISDFDSYEWLLNVSTFWGKGRGYHDSGIEHFFSNRFTWFDSLWKNRHDWLILDLIENHQKRWIISTNKERAE